MTTIPLPTAAEVLAELRAVILRILRMDPADDFAVEPGARLTEELGLESIDLVNIGAMLTERYGEAVNLAVYLADREIDDVIELTVGALVGFVRDALAAGVAAGARASAGVSVSASASASASVGAAAAAGAPAQGE
jgi:acyl carrier protein